MTDLQRCVSPQIEDSTYRRLKRTFPPDELKSRDHINALLAATAENELGPDGRLSYDVEESDEALCVLVQCAKWIFVEYLYVATVLMRGLQFPTFAARGAVFVCQL